MTQNKLSAQLYTVRDSTKTLDGFTESMKKISNIGYTAVQVSAIGGDIPFEDVKRVADDLGMKICITHIPYDRLWNDIDSVIAQHQLWDCQHVAIGSMPRHYVENGIDGLRQFAQEASAVGEKLYNAGLTFSYHNHSFEFIRVGAQSGLEILYAESDPRYLQAEIDTYWIQFGGADPAEWIRRMTNRMPAVHLKDMVILRGHEQAMAEVGEGNMNWPNILAACAEANVEWYCVEQDICQRDPFESLKISYDNLVAMGIS